MMDIFNADGEFLPAVYPLAVRGDLCCGERNLSPDDGDVLHKLDFLVTGKSTNPKCFKMMKFFTCDYEANKLR